MQEEIIVRGAKENNLKNISVSTVSLFLGIVTEIFFKLFSFAPLTIISSCIRLFSCLSKF